MINIDPRKVIPSRTCEEDIGLDLLDEVSVDSKIFFLNLEDQGVPIKDLNLTLETFFRGWGEDDREGHNTKKRMMLNQ